MGRVAAGGGPIDGRYVSRWGEGGGVACWMDGDGRSHSGPAPGRALYFAEGTDRLVFRGHGARQCPGCGVVIDPDPVSGGPLPGCPLCGALKA